MTRSKQGPSWRGRRAGFSRHEFIFLLGLLLFCAAVAFPAWEFVRRWQRLVMARGDLKSVVSAVQLFHARYHVWPGQTLQHGDVHYGRTRSNAEVMNILRAADGPGNAGHVLNSNRVVFLDVATAAPGLSGLNSRGEFLDPWGSQYHIVLDLDYDNVCVTPDTIYQRIQGEGIIAWSNGPDRRSDTDDDLRSWKWVLPRRSALPGF